MNEEIIKLAKDCGYWSGETVEMNDVGIESFYKAAYNNAIDDVRKSWNGGITLADICALRKEK